MKQKIKLILLAAFFKAGLIFSQIPKDGLIGKWTFTGNANDSSGKGNHGTVTGAILTADRFGVTNSAYSFDGNSNIHIGCGVNSLSPSTFTLACWVRIPTDNDGGRRTIIRNWMYGYTFLTLENKILVDLHNPSTMAFQRFASTKNYNDGKWHQIILSVNSTYRKVYVDGNLEDSTGTGYNNYYVNKCITFGADTKNSNLGFTGDIDDICFFDRNLTKRQIDSLFNDGVQKEMLYYTEKQQSTRYRFGYPNPVIDYFYLCEFSEKVQLLDNTGKMLNEFILTKKSNNRIDLSNYSNGVYFVQKQEVGAVFTQKIFKF